MFLKTRCLHNEKQKYCFYSPEEIKKKKIKHSFTLSFKKRHYVGYIIYTNIQIYTNIKYIESEVNSNMVGLNKIVLRIASQCYLQCICDSVKILENSATK